MPARPTRPGPVSGPAGSRFGPGQPGRVPFRGRPAPVQGCRTSRR